MKERAAMIVGQIVEALNRHGFDNFGVVPSSEFMFQESFYGSSQITVFLADQGPFTNRRSFRSGRRYGSYSPIRCRTN